MVLLDLDDELPPAPHEDLEEENNGTSDQVEENIGDSEREDYDDDDEERPGGLVDDTDLDEDDTDDEDESDGEDEYRDLGFARP